MTASVRFTSKISQATPLILAAKNRRADIVAALIKAEASVSARDIFDRSPLFYASRIGDIDSVKLLLKAKSPANDGSLQEAARNLHSAVVAALIKAKHDPNFPSSRYQGRTALQEMALMCDASNDTLAVEETLKALLKGTPKLLDKSWGKNALFLALDNPRPVPITRALLDLAMWKQINLPENIYTVPDDSGTEYFFSPTMYVSMGLSQGPKTYNEALLNLLRDKRCEDRYYAQKDAQQPDRAVGMPQDILDAEHNRKQHEDKIRKRELDHQLKQLHLSQEASLRKEIEHQKHQAKMFQDEETHRQELLQKAQKTQQTHDILSTTASLKKSLQEDQEASKRRAAEFELHQKTRMTQLKNDGLAKERALKLHFDHKAAQQRLQVQERQNRLAAAANENKMLTAQNMARSREVEQHRRLAIKAKQDELALWLMRGTEANKRVVHEMKMEEMQARGEQVKLALLREHFGGQGRNLKRIGGG